MKLIKKEYILSLSILTLMFFSILGVTKSDALTYGDFTYRYENEAVVIEGYNGENSEITIPSSINGYKVKKISDEAFYENGTIKKVTIPEGVVEIGQLSFKDAKNLEEVKLPSTLKLIGADAFYRCENLNKINLPKNLTAIHDNTFYKCESLEEIVIPDNVTYIGERAFQYCYNLEKVTMSNNMEDIDYAAFNSCESLKSIVLPKTLKYLSYDVFDNCTNLESVKIYSENLDYGSYAYGTFEHCPNLVVYGYKNSTTEKYTSKYKVSFLPLYKEFTKFTNNKVSETSTYISGYGEKGATVKAYVNGKQIGKTSTVSSNGTYKITIPKQKSSTKITLKMSKTGYATKSISTTVYKVFSKFTINTVKTSSTYVSGSGLKGATVKAYVNGKQIGKTSTVASNGAYKITIPKQKANTKVVVKMSKSGYITSEKSTTVLNVFTTFTVNSIESKSTSISGKGVKGSTVRAYVNGKQIGKMSTVASNGTYKITIPKQKSGRKVTVKISKSGYVTSEKTITVKK